MKNPPKRPQHNPSALDALARKKKTEQTAFKRHIRATLSTGPTEPFFHLLDFAPLSGQLEKVSWNRCLSTLTCVIIQPLSGQLKKVSWYRCLSCYQA
ncbi:unnamed protein product [Porites evermanni]|uniref:Uncharacterized protein n=1 Tax=Porites evermanni TaxID=104178 RepID=A0ABN8QTW9_9CNID|nr:unnamed protein product [Porites evermanni]